MKRIYLIGIGPGNPDYLTIQAINIMKKIDVFFLIEKEDKEELVKIREEILGRYLEGGYRVVRAKSPKRKKGSLLYDEGVKRWRCEKAKIITELIKNKMNDGENGAFLVWGDPSLYDGYLQILQDIEKEINLEYEVIPGISSIQVLVAKHKIPLNRIGENILITTGRNLKECQPSDIKNAVVLLDSHSTFSKFKDTDLEIYWGGYLGTKDEILFSGKLKDVEALIKIKDKASKKKGYLMETYILRKNE